MQQEPERLRLARMWGTSRGRPISTASYVGCSPMMMNASHSKVEWACWPDSHDPDTPGISTWNADSTIETAVADLRIRAEADLGDHFRFAYVTHTEAMHEGRVTGEPGTKITFEIYIEARSLGRCSVDVAIHPRPAIDFEIKDPSSRLHLPRLTTSP